MSNPMVVTKTQLCKQKRKTVEQTGRSWELTQQVVV